MFMYEFFNSDKDEANKQQAVLQTQIREMSEEFEKKNLENQQKQEEMMKIIDKKNYESHFMVPEVLRKHRREHPKSFDIQVKAFSIGNDFVKLVFKSSIYKS